jgi:all-trans-retinol dehydrogenase (NAD+)
MFFTLTLIFWGVVFYTIYFYIAYRRRDLKGKRALITGGGSGIGRLMALKLAQKGVRLVLWDVNTAGLDKVRSEVEALGGVCQTAVIDVTNRDLVYATAKECGPIDILINNAGIVTGKSLLDCPDELMLKTVQVNTISHFWTIKAFLPAMLKANEGNIVTIASAAGLCGVAGLVDYCASKFGAVGTAEALYMELRKLKTKVRSTLVCPYYINTGMFDGVQSRFPLLLPILDENYAANRIVLGIERGEESICMPYIVGVSMVARFLPASWQAFIAETLGISDSMDHFKGRAASPAKKSN